MSPSLLNYRKKSFLVAFLPLDLMKDRASAGISQIHIVKNYHINLLPTLSQGYEVMKLSIKDVDPIQNPITKP